MIKVKDLKDQIRVEGNRSLLFCSICFSESSANKGDYFMASPNHIFTCCNEPMILVTKQTMFKEVTV